jgi:radical SAM protein with 4Fe4S-binding SPASM domain
MTRFCTAPYVYTFEITSACNANCVGCGNVFSHDGTHLTASDCRAILGHLSHPEMFRVTGGEPTLCPEFGPILRLLDSQRKPIVLFTNGAWQDPEYVVDMLRACKNLDGILVSLHGHDAASHQAFAGTEHFPAILANIRRAREAGIAVNTNTILTRRNIDHMAEVVEVATRAGAQVVAFSRHYGLPIPNLTDLSPQQYHDAVVQVGRFRTAGKLVKFNNNIPFCVGGALTQACPAGDTHCTVSPTGTARLCNHSPLEIGDLLHTPIEKLWRSEAVARWRRQVPDMCQRCAAFELCRGGCRANAHANRLAADPLACGPCQSKPRVAPIRHALWGESCARAAFSRHAEPFGYVLINRSRILKVAPEARPLLDALERGDSTLTQICATFGQPALNLVGYLYDNRMIVLNGNGAAGAHQGWAFAGSLTSEYHAGGVG